MVLRCILTKIFEGGQRTAPLGRITNASLYYVQHNWDKTNNEASRVIAQQVLIYLESADKNN